ncbi:MAG: hypothetical protein ACFWUC_06520 [Oscillospiraceae bacterium]|jgi:hypothetical protein
MSRAKTLKVLAWVFSAAAIVAAIYNAVSGKGGKECVALITFALLVSREVRNLGALKK